MPLSGLVDLNSVEVIVRPLHILEAAVEQRFLADCWTTASGTVRWEITWEITGPIFAIFGVIWGKKLKKLSGGMKCKKPRQRRGVLTSERATGLGPATSSLGSASGR